MRAIHTLDRTAHWSLVTFGLVLVVLGFVLWLGGVRLVLLGGSWYYVLAATCMWIAGGLLMFGRKLPAGANER